MFLGKYKGPQRTLWKRRVDESPSVSEDLKQVLVIIGRNEHNRVILAGESVCQFSEIPEETSLHASLGSVQRPSDVLTHRFARIGCSSAVERLKHRCCTGRAILLQDESAGVVGWLKPAEHAFDKRVPTYVGAVDCGAETNIDRPIPGSPEPRDEMVGSAAIEISLVLQHPAPFPRAGHEEVPRGQALNRLRTVPVRMVCHTWVRCWPPSQRPDVA